MTEELKLDLMKKFKELNVAEYTTKYGDYYGLMFAGAEIATKELEATNERISDECHKLVDSLEKKQNENAELNQKVIDLENDREIFLSDFYCDKKGTCKLTKAKEIIKKLMVFAEADLREYEEEYKEAEQFLMEE